ncbi:MAG: zinc ribbon domain-containing protein [Verrucomicrobiales bacterium]|nr:zinc ribbon domain-containing protein [Verrucomicrobiales bacterium]
MAELNALNKFACPACGADARWEPSKQALVCPYCSTVSPAKLSADGTLIEESDLVSALRQLTPEQRGWKAVTKSVRCQNCNAISVFDPKRVAQRCDFCGSPAIVPFEEQQAPIRPASLLPFKIPENQVRDSMRRWYATRWFAPNKLKSRAITDTVHGVYLPYWTFDAQVHADWTAESGYYYYVTETYRDAQGKTQTRQVRKVRWVPSSGDLDHFFDDELVSASKGVRGDLLAKIEPFPTTTELKPYDPGYVAGWVVEQYQLDLVAAAQHSRSVMDAKVRNLCASQVPGDTHRNLRVAADYSGQTFKHILVPVWLLTYDYGRKSYQVVANGCSGAIAGDRPYSWIKITLAVLAALILIGIIVVAAQQ